mgnify:CR=1 FL=1
MDEIYMDWAATSPVRPEVAEAMAPYLADRFGNPSSVHRWGRAARAALEEARERLAAVLGAARREIVFTGSGTEADNLAVLGRARAVARSGQRVIVACTAIEHKAVLEPARQAAREGAELLVMAVDETGRLDLGALDEALAAGPAVVSVQWGNNEIGTLQPIDEVADRCRSRGITFHSDAVQALGRVPVRVDRTPCDLLTVSAHKLGGPKGVGALYVREGTELEALIFGGGQEWELRPGTQNVAGAVGLAVAAELAVAEMEAESARIGALRDRLESGLRERIDGLVVHGAGAPRLSHILNVGIPGVDQEAILMALDLEGIAVSSGSACQSGAVEASHVLVAIGAAHATPDPDRPDPASIRFSLGRTTTSEHVDRVIDRVPEVVKRLRALGSNDLFGGL